MKLSDLAKRMIIAILFIALIFIIGSAIYYRSLSFLPFVFGILIGTAVSIIKVFLLEHAVDKALTMEQNHAGNYVRVHHIFRLLLTGVALFLGAVVPQISLWGVAIGILAFQLAIYIAKFKLKS
jgi:energy-coupling factor transporter transmembrane protein EcfT